jgi:hypothetical protein
LFRVTDIKVMLGKGGRRVGEALAQPSRSCVRSLVSKVAMNNPVVEMEGDEMAQVLWRS